MNFKAAMLVELFNRTNIPEYGIDGKDSIHCQIIYAIVRWLQPHVCVELGSYIGHSAMWTVAALAQNGDGHLWCVDNFVKVGTGKKEEFERNTGYLGETITLINKPTSDSVELVPSDVDFLFIDANHDYESCSEDMRNYIPKLRSGGAVLLHDYDTRTNTGVQKSVGSYDWEGFEQIPLPTYYYGLWLGVRVRIRI